MEDPNSKSIINEAEHSVKDFLHVKCRLGFFFMPRAIVLVNADVGKEGEVYSSIKSIPEVVEAYTSYGTYDIIAIVNAETNEKLKGIITSRIRAIPSIRSTLSMPVVD